MAEGLILRFPGASADDYKEVHAALGFDEENRGDWPDGMIAHAGGVVDGTLYIMETWESRAAHQRWMEGRVAQAFQNTGFQPEPPEITWIPLVNYHIPQRAAVSS